MSKIIAVVGYPASGKSYFIETYFKNSFNIIDVDRFTHLPLEERYDACNELLKDCYDNGKDCVLLGTAKTDRMKLTTDFFKDAGYELIVIYIKCSLFTCLKRNKNRDRVVPSKVFRQCFFNMRKNLNKIRKTADKYYVVKGY